MSRRRPHIRRAVPACDPAHIIKRSPQTEILRHRNGGTDDIIEAILYMDAHAGNWILTEKVDCLRGYDDVTTLKNVWTFVGQNVKYRPDKPGHERVKSPGALYASGFGDCKSFSIAAGALLKALGFTYRYRFTAYEPGDFTHVYVIATTPAGNDVILDAVHKRFNEEIQYQRKKDIYPQQTAIAGIPTQQPQPAKYPLFRLGFFAAMLYWLTK